MSKAIVIGSRGSDLALWQANYTKDQLEKLGHSVTIKIIKTQGDRIQHLSFDKLEGKGFFTKEIEEQLLSGAIDVAVHSHKDLETTPPAGLLIAAVPEREAPSDLLLIKKDKVDASKQFSLAEGAIVGTSSARRKNQIKAFRPDVELADIRGNVPTRIEKLRTESFDAIMLAKAGVVRLELDLSDFHVEELNPKEFIPAPAQGALGLQIREDDADMKAILSNLNDKSAASRIQIERKVLNLFQGGCQLPLGVYVEADGDEFNLWASLANKWEDMPRRIQISGRADQLAVSAVEELKKKS
ncbi:MAG: hydroxymethylbilane synthase [Flavobacteriales bacterium]|nr:hydroxymethylbilane synthase [Flavobacteriales bacterium]